MQLTSSVKFLPAISVTNGAAGTTAISGTAIDTAGFDGVAFVTQLGAIVSGAVTSLKLQHSATTTDGDFSDVTSATLTVADTDDEDIKVLYYNKPAKRYVRIVCSRGTQNATLSTIAQLYNACNQPAAQTAANTVVVGVSG